MGLSQNGIEGPQLFDAFSTKADGMGMGLSMSRSDARRLMEAACGPSPMMGMALSFGSRCRRTKPDEAAEWDDDPPQARWSLSVR